MGGIQKPDALTTPLRTTTGPGLAQGEASVADTAAKPGAAAADPASNDQAVLSEHAAARAATPPAQPAEAPKGLDIGGIFDRVKSILGRAVEIIAEIPAAWSLGDATGLLTAVEALPANDRPALAKARFVRTTTLPQAQADRPNYGNIDFMSAEKGGPVTIKIADIASKAGIVAQVVAHEIGHCCQGHGRWDADQVREFAKLSQWVLPGQPETLVNGYDKFHRPKAFEADGGELARPKNATNLVSEFAAGSAAEDYAESYRTYLLEPQVLMAKAPEKFLYINATSAKFSAADVQRMAADAGVDLAMTMAGLRQSTLRPETVDQIARGNFLLGVGDSGTAAGDAISFIQDRAGDPAFAGALRADARTALGDNIWSRLSTAEQRLLAQPAYVDKLLAATVANKTAPRDTISNSEVGAWKDFFKSLLDSPPDDVKLSLSDDKFLFMKAHWFGKTPSKKPAQARFDYVWGKLHDPAIWNRLSPETRALIESPAGRKTIWNLANDKNILEVSRKLWGGVKVMGMTIGGKADPRYRENVLKTIDRIGPAEVQFTIEMVQKGLTAEDLAMVGKVTLDMARNGVYQHSNDFGITAA
jgi:hypothetical protein